MNKKITSLLGSAAVASSMLVAPVTSIADDAILTGNAGILSDYIFRGITQSSGVGNGGLDVEYMGFYAGTWLADVDEGIEYDLYAGYVYEFESGFYLGAGYTTYQYSDDFDDDYNEINFYAGGSFGDVSLDLEYTTGEYDGEFTDDDGDTGDEYDFIALTVGYAGAYATYGTFGDDAEDSLGEYFEVGYTMEIGGLEVTGAVVHHYDFTDGTSVNSDDDETEAYVSISWGFDVI